MKKENISVLKNYLSSNKSLKVCILDNNSIEFLTQIKNDISPEKIFNYYDIILIPSWVWVEICDSNNRESYIKELKQTYSKKVIIVDEIDYLELVDYKETELYYLFLYSCDNVSRLVSFIKRNISKSKPLEDLAPYEEWLNLLYEEGLEKNQLSNGRLQRKNAGEISIAVLSYILSYYYGEKIDNITIFTQDRDGYDFIYKAKELFNRDKNFKTRYRSPITFKSNDVLIYEWTSLGFISFSKVNHFVNKYRQARRIKLSRKKHDCSIEEQYKLIDNCKFIELLNDSSVYIIF